MLKISERQWAIFNVAQREIFLLNLIEVMRPLFSDEDLLTDAAFIKKEFSSVLAIAEGWGIKSGYPLVQHVIAAKLIGSDYFEVYSFAGDVMQSPDLDDETKGWWLEKWIDALS